jgi:hypothetical protein
VTPDIFVLPDPGTVGLRAASIFSDLSKETVKSKGRFSVALSGGRTPLDLFGQLGVSHVSRWDLTDIFWADERCVPPDHQDSNYKGAYDALLSRMYIPPANHGSGDPLKRAKEYEMNWAPWRQEFACIRPYWPFSVGKTVMPSLFMVRCHWKTDCDTRLSKLKSWRITLTPCSE